MIWVTTAGGAIVSSLPPTNAYLYMRIGILVFAALMVWILVATIRVVHHVAKAALSHPREGQGDDGESPEGNSADDAGSTPAPVSESLSGQSGELLRFPTPDSIRYHSLVPVIESIESSREIARRGAELVNTVVPSASTITFAVGGEGRDYQVSIIPLACECAWWEHRGSPASVCKHIVAVAGYVLDAIGNGD